MLLMSSPSCLISCPKLFNVNREILELGNWLPSLSESSGYESQAHDCPARKAHRSRLTLILIWSRDINTPFVGILGKLEWWSYWEQGYQPPLIFESSWALKIPVPDAFGDFHLTVGDARRFKLAVNDVDDSWAGVINASEKARLKLKPFGRGKAWFGEAGRSRKISKAI